MPPNYKCLHQRLLRRAGSDASDMYLDAQRYIGDPAPRRKATVWTSRQTDNPTIVPEFFEDVKIFVPNCGFPACDDPFDSCRNDTISQGLFYAGTSPPLRITASRNPDDFANLAPMVGPRCFVPYRHCDEDCDTELGSHLDNGQVRPRQGFIYAKPWGGPVECSVADGCTEEGIYTELQFDKAVCARMQALPDGAWVDGEASTLPFVLLNQHAPDDQPLQNAFRASNVIYQPAMTWCVWEVRFDFFTIQRLGLKAGAATMHFLNWDGSLLTLQDDNAAVTYTVGISLGKFYLYEPPRSNAVLSPQVVYNGECRSPVFIAMPPNVNVMNYGGFLCAWRSVSSAEGFRTVDEMRLWRGSRSPRGLYCRLPVSLAASVLEFQISLNGQHRHTIEMRLEKQTPIEPGVPGKGALRLYSIVPRSGPSSGGTQIIVHGKHFSLYRGNKILCRFTFNAAGVDSDLDFAALYLDDERLQCTTPAALLFSNQAAVQISVDGRDFCNAAIVGTDKWYNRATFFYTEEAAAPILNVAWSKPLMSWTKCHSFAGTFATNPSYPVSNPKPTPVITCDALPQSPDMIAELGYFGCLHDLDDDPSNPHSVDNPIWCMRAVPANGGTAYMFWLYDPFWKMEGYMLRPVPVLQPGTCVRHRSALDQNILIRFKVIFELIPSPGLTVDEEWEFFKENVEAEVMALEGVEFGAGFLRGTRDEQELLVDFELNSKLAQKQDLLTLLLALRNSVMIGQPEGGRYYSSNLTFADVKVLAMSEPSVDEELKYTRWTTQLDYRVNDIHAHGQRRGTGANSSTQGKRLIEKITSNHALVYGDGRDMSYMKEVLHTLGETYGFVDLTTTAFFIEWDATVATEYDEVKYRQQSLCSKRSSAAFKQYSGIVGDDESYIDWFDLDWSKGKPICKNPNCAQAPFAEPAQGNLQQGMLDKALGCLRLRVGFNCTNFDLGRCMKEKADPGFNFGAAKQYAHAGVRAEHLDDTAWCNSYYPEQWGPNNAENDAGKQSEYRYRYRLSPCIACRQARDICAAMEGGNAAGEDRQSNGDLDFAAELSLGCFGMEHSGGAVQDQCCDQACDHAACSTGLEPCIRAKNNPICADPRHATKDLHDKCDMGPPLCAPRVFI